MSSKTDWTLTEIVTNDRGWITDTAIRLAEKFEVPRERVDDLVGHAVLEAVKAEKRHRGDASLRTYLHRTMEQAIYFLLHDEDPVDRALPFRYVKELGDGRVGVSVTHDSDSDAGEEDDGVVIDRGSFVGVVAHSRDYVSSDWRRFTEPSAALSTKVFEILTPDEYELVRWKMDILDATDKEIAEHFDTSRRTIGRRWDKVKAELKAEAQRLGWPSGQHSVTRMPPLHSESSESSTLSATSGRMLAS